MNPIQQGDIFLVNLNPVQGHEQAGLRPALVVQQDTLNLHLNTVIIAPITSNLVLKGKLTTHFLPKKDSGLRQDSLILLYQIRTLDKGRLIKKVGHLEADEFFDLRTKLMRMFW
jgi:mRNA interferase MazF